MTNYRFTESTYQPVSSKALFLYLQFIYETEGTNPILSLYDYDRFLSDFNYEDSAWRTALRELIQNGLIKIVGDRVCVGDSKLFSVKKKSEVYEASEIDSFVNNYKLVSPKLEYEIDSRKERIVNYAKSFSMKIDDVIACFTMVYELVYQEIGRTRPYTKKEYALFRSVAKLYEPKVLVKMIILFFKDVDKYFRNAAPNIQTFNFVKDKIYLDATKKSKDSKQAEGFTYD